MWLSGGSNGSGEVPSDDDFGGWLAAAAALAAVAAAVAEVAAAAWAGLGAPIHKNRKLLEQALLSIYLDRYIYTYICNDT